MYRELYCKLLKQKGSSRVIKEYTIERAEVVRRKLARVCFVRDVYRLIKNDGK